MNRGEAQAFDESATYLELSFGLAGGLGVPMVLALATASWVWMLPETRGIALPSLSAETPARS